MSGDFYEAARADRLERECASLRAELAAMRKERDRLRAALEQIAERRRPEMADKGCLDGNCLIYRPQGQHTNSHCGCAGDRLRGKWVGMLLANAYYSARAALDAAKKETK